MKNNKKYCNPMELDLLQQKLDKAINEINELKRTKSNKEFILDAMMKERDRATLAAKYLTHLLLVMDSLDRILYDDPNLGYIVKEAIYDFKAKLNEGMLNIEYDGQNLWYEGGYNDEEGTDDDETD